jgi:hypothetical protein
MKKNQFNGNVPAYRELQIYEVFQNLIPPLPVAEFSQLEQNILDEGIRDPIVVWEDTDYIVDGHNRYTIAQKHNLPFPVKEMEFADEETAKEWIIMNQFGRRNLNPYSKCLLALKMRQTVARRASLNQGNKSGVISAINTNKILAEMAGVSHDTISRVIAIEDTASASVKKQLLAGAMSINQAYKSLPKQQSQNRQSVEISDTAVAIPAPVPTIDCLVSMPNGVVKDRACFTSLLDFAGEVVKPNGFILLWTRQQELPAAMSSIDSDSFDYYWTLAVKSGQSEDADTQEQDVKTTVLNEIGKLKTHLSSLYNRIINSVQTPTDISNIWQPIVVIRKKGTQSNPTPAIPAQIKDHIIGKSKEKILAAIIEHFSAKGGSVLCDETTSCAAIKGMGRICQQIERVGDKFSIEPEVELPPDYETFVPGISAKFIVKKSEIARLMYFRDSYYPTVRESYSYTGSAHFTMLENKLEVVLESDNNSTNFPCVPSMTIEASIEHPVFAASNSRREFKVDIDRFITAIGAAGGHARCALTDKYIFIKGNNPNTLTRLKLTQE